MRTALCVGTLALIGWSCISIRTPDARVLQNAAGGITPDALASEVDPDALLIVWSFETGDLLGCESPALALRHLQRRFDSQVKLRIIAVGPDPNVVDPFMRRERLKGDVLRMSPQEYRRRFGDAALPRLQMMRSGHPDLSLQGETWSDGTGVDERGIEQTGRRLLESPSVALH